MEKIDKCFIINLDRRQDRWKHSLTELKNGNIPMTKVERVTAIDGSKMTDTEIASHTTKFCNKHCLPSMVAVALSHRKVWTTVLKDPSIQTAIVFEDDFILPNRFEESLRKYIRGLPEDWKMLYLSCYGDCYGATWGNKVIGKFTIGNFASPTRVFTGPNTKDNNSSKSDLPVGDLYRPTSPLALVGYIINKKGARELLHLTTEINYHVDIQIAQCTQFMRKGVYQVDNCFITQNANDSDNTIENGKHIIVNKFLGSVVDRDTFNDLLVYINSPWIKIGQAKLDVFTTALFVLALVSSVILRTDELRWSAGILFVLSLLDIFWVKDKRYILLEVALILSGIGCGVALKKLF